MSKASRRARRAQRRFERIGGFVRGATCAEPTFGIVAGLWQQVPRLLRSLERTTVTVVADGATHRIRPGIEALAGGRRTR